jgi:hypothetical protein
MFSSIKKISKKKSKEDRQYMELRKKYLMDNPMCHAHLHCCSERSTDVHHKKGRGKYYLIIETWISLCRPCHQYIEMNPDFSKEMEFSEKR